ncbi:glycoside hydrolase family 32 protein [Kineococcus sp. SYSU DK002]|uniref:glycoside hydrolase family 32 protein n=1 Tax=Kineococcus sp. SYSU DK002 TaxID=3383123 RepID=UPI003D7D47FD
MTDFRPLAHFTAVDTWLNDPNGLLHRDGLWHLFFQNNPHGADWGNMSWGHAVSRDLLHWEHRPLAISHEGPEAIFSGSAVVHDGRVAAVYTSAYDDGRQAQSLAWSEDGDTFVKDPANPVLDRGSTGFRDPKVFRYGDGWRMVTVEADERTVLVHSSTDLRSWTEVGRFSDEPGVGIWECPDLFPLDLDGQERWVLLLSVQDATGSRVEYRVGSFDGARFTGGPARSFDVGPDVYAVSTWTDAPDGRRVLIGWMAQPTYAGATPTAPWRGAMTLPRDLSLTAGDDGEPVLVQSFSPEVVAAYAHEVTGLPPAALLRCGFSGDATWEFAAGPDVLRLAVEGTDLVVDRSRCGDVGFHGEFARTDRVPLPAGTTGFSVFLDRCSVEVLAGPLSVTQLVFPAEPLSEVRTGGSARVEVLAERARQDAAPRATLGP